MFCRTANFRFLLLGSRASNVPCVNNYVTRQQRIYEISNLYGVSEVEAKDMMRENQKLKTIDFKRLEKQLKVLRSLQIETKNIQKFPKVATLVSGRLKNRYYTLLELGFKDVTMDDIVKFTDTIALNIESDMISWDPIESICLNVEGPSNLKEIIITKYKDKSVMTLKWLHRVVLLEYLVWKLNLSRNDVMVMVAKYPSLASSSITNLKDCIDMLINDYKFTPKKIQANGFLLVLSLESVDYLITLNPVLGGVPIKSFVLRFPRILTSDAKNVQQVNEYLKQFDVMNEQILTTGNIYSLNPATLLKRLESVEFYPEITKLKHVRCYLEIIYYFEKAVSRLVYIRPFNFDNISLELLISSENRFKKAFASLCKSKKRREISRFLSEKFNLRYNLIFARLNYKGNFNWVDVDLKTVEKTFEYLLETFSESEILKDLPVVLFDVELVREFVTENPNLTIVREKLFALVDPSDQEDSDVESKSQLKYGKCVSDSHLSIKSYLNPKQAQKKRSHS